MWNLLALLVLSSVYSTAYADYERMDCKFEWSEISTEIRRVLDDSSSPLGSSPRESSSPRTYSQSSPRLGTSPQREVSGPLGSAEAGKSNLSPQTVRHALNRSRQGTLQGAIEIKNHSRESNFPLNGDLQYIEFDILENAKLVFHSKDE